MIATAAVVLVVIMVNLATLAAVDAPPPPSSPPIPISQYGITTVYANQATQTSLGAITVTLTSNGYGAFFVVRLLIFMNTPAQSDLTLDSIEIDGFYTLSFSQYYGTPKVVVIASGQTVGDIISVLPAYLSILLVKDPLGNQAIALNGRPGNGLTASLAFSTQVGAPISAEAIVTAPSNDTITISIS
jgi:hypothetical protein